MKQKDDFVKILLMFDQMSKDLSIGRLTNSEKDILLKLHNELANKEKKLVDIRLVKFRIILASQYQDQQFISLLNHY